MADSTIDSDRIVLNSSAWGATPWPMGSVPADGFTGASHHNVADSPIKLGTMIQVYNTGLSAGVAGHSQLIYLELAGQDATNVLKAKQLVTLIDNYDGDAGGPRPFHVTNEVAHDLGAGQGPVAVGLSAMATGRKGWFWCGGVCPEEFVAALGGNYATDGTVAAGPMTTADLASPGVAVGEIGFSAQAADAVSATVGQALSADAA